MSRCAASSVQVFAWLPAIGALAAVIAMSQPPCQQASFGDLEPAPEGPAENPSFPGTERAETTIFQASHPRLDHAGRLRIDRRPLLGPRPSADLVESGADQPATNSGRHSTQPPPDRSRMAAPKAARHRSVLEGPDRLLQRDHEGDAIALQDGGYGPGSRPDPVWSRRRGLRDLPAGLRAR